MKGHKMGLFLGSAMEEVLSKLVSDSFHSRPSFNILDYSTNFVQNETTYSKDEIFSFGVP
jgi:hypothetical protein